MSRPRQGIEHSQSGCVILLLDHSFSMREGFAGLKKSKARVMAAVVNRFLLGLLDLCGRDAKPRFHLDVGVLSYTTDVKGVPVIRSPLTGPLAGRDLVSTTDLHDNPLDVEVRQQEDGTGGVVDVKFPVWYRQPSLETMAGTPMSAALQRCLEVTQGWCARHRDSFPPVVVQITDGEPTDGDPEAAARQLRSTATKDGNLLLCHLVLSGNRVDPILLPAGDAHLPDEYVRALYWASSPLPLPLRQLADVKRLPASPGCRLLAVNVDLPQVLTRIIGGGSDGSAVPINSLTAAGTDSDPPSAGRMPVRLRRCPRCDRLAHGNPGQRHCLACDHKF